MSATPASRGLLLPRLAAALGASLILSAAAVPAAAAVPSVPSTTYYYRTRDLDVRPGILTRVEPAYPDTALARGLSGKVVLRLYIDEKGAVERVETLSAQPAGYFEASAEQAFRAARFTPGRKGKQAVKTQMVIEVSFEAPAAAARGSKR
ncbi:MAG TPA: energy transducer TonB [Candidatus Methylomirabilis sp.]|nr:energy transducer TonB [Candidatus Methylomirabilis sp.]